MPGANHFLTPLSKVQSFPLPTLFGFCDPVGRDVCPTDYFTTPHEATMYIQRLFSIFFGSNRHSFTRL